MKKTNKIYIAGHAGLVGSALLLRLKSEGYANIVTKTSKELDLRRQADVERFFEAERPEYVFLAAAKVGGIHANDTCRAEFIYDNLMIEANIIHAAYKYGVKKLLFLGSSCIYPKLAPQPMKEAHLLTGPLEPTNEPYAIAKIAGIKLCESYNRQYGTDFISCMPTNLYGPHDNFDPMGSHVIPGLMRRFHEAKTVSSKQKSVRSSEVPSGLLPDVVIWGTGTPKREFLYVEDLADACLFLMKNYSGSETVNIGSGIEVTIRELAGLIKDIVGFRGEIVYDASKPDGTPRKLLDSSKINAMGWKATTTLEEGLRRTYAWFVRNSSTFRGSPFITF